MNMMIRLVLLQNTSAYLKITFTKCYQGEYQPNVKTYAVACHYCICVQMTHSRLVLKNNQLPVLLCIYLYRYNCNILQGMDFTSFENCRSLYIYHQSMILICSMWHRVLLIW